jgi:hypothetical protein
MYFLLFGSRIWDDSHLQQVGPGREEEKEGQNFGVFTVADYGKTNRTGKH